MSIKYNLECTHVLFKIVYMHIVLWHNYIFNNNKLTMFWIEEIFKIRDKVD